MAQLSRNWRNSALFWDFSSFRKYLFSLEGHWNRRRRTKKNGITCLQILKTLFCLKSILNWWSLTYRHDKKRGFLCPTKKSFQLSAFCSTLDLFWLNGWKSRKYVGFWLLLPSLSLLHRTISCCQFDEIFCNSVASGSIKSAVFQLFAEQFC